MKSNYKQRLQERERRAYVSDTATLCWNMMLVSLNEEFGFGRERLTRLWRRWNAMFEEYAKLLDDGRDYADAHLAKRVREIMEGSK